jgi:DNA-binding transcriptional MerR regulator
LIPHTFYSREMPRFGITLRQQQWWVDNGLLGKDRRVVGHRREFSAADMLTLLIVRELRRKNFSNEQIKRARHKLQDLKSRFLLATPELQLRWVETPEQVIAVFKKQQGGLYVIDIEALRSELSVKVKAATA